MITTIGYQPPVWSSAYNPIIWSFTSTKITQIDFSFVIDVTVFYSSSDIRTFRELRPANPAGYGMIDVAPIVQSYVNLTNWSFENTGSILPPYRTGQELVPWVYIDVGEQYRTTATGPLVLYNGYDSPGTPSYTIGSASIGTPCAVLPSALEFREGQKLLSNIPYLGTQGYFTPYVMRVVTPGKFLKRGPNTIKLRSNDQYTLSMLNWDYQAILSGTSYAAPIQCIVVNSYNSSGTLLTTAIYQNITSLGGWNSAATYTGATINRTANLLHFRAGPSNVTLGGGAAYYTVQAYKKTSATSSTTPGAACSELLTFIIDDGCQDLYPNIRLSWLNDLGGRDYHNFTMFYQRSTTASEDSYYQSPIKWSSSTPVESYLSSDTSGNWQRGGNKVYNKITTTTYSIQSDWLLQEEVDYLGYIPESPSVWAYIGDGTEPYTVTIKNLTWDYKNVKQQKLVQASFEMEYTKNSIKQNM